MSRDSVNFVMDLDDDEVEDTSLHLAAFVGQLDTVRQILAQPDKKDLLRTRIRPFLATPLRLAATSGHADVVTELLQQGAEVDVEDIKAQTPVFIALVNQHWDTAKVLLEHGANPNGSMRNLCSPLSILCQRGFHEGIQLLCEFGADTEDVLRILSGMPGLPLTTCATYHHLRSFVTLLLNGAAPDLTNFRELNLQDFVNSQCSVPHTIIKYKCPVEFMYLYREFGGSLKLRDARGQLASEISESAPALDYLKQVQDVPLSLLSQARLSIRKSFNGNLHLIHKLELGHNILDILLFRVFDPALFNLDNPDEVRMYKELTETCGTIPTIKNSPTGKKWKEKLYRDLDQALNGAEEEHHAEERRPSIVRQAPGGAGPPPPPPPPAPAPPRPKLFRYPSAEGLKKSHFNGY